ncbi:MAG TPA: AAA family ATPase [Polyangiaceae bacterium]|nr:AAA family ATPase [Polyangiaceae bacterium]
MTCSAIRDPATAAPYDATTLTAPRAVMIAEFCISACHLDRLHGPGAEQPRVLRDPHARANVVTAMTLEPRIAADLLRRRNCLLESGDLRPESDLARCYATFADHFGPRTLRGLDGPELLDRIHNHGNRESLVYWLEFKNDEEMPGIFGSIAGGSALKFGIYRRKETGTWMTGSPTAQRELSIDEAVAVARRNKEQLLAGFEVLEHFRASTGKNYAALQKEMSARAPDLADLAWGHKYFSLLFPDLLDDYHAPDYQRFHLIKLLQAPPSGPGRFIAAGAFVAAARELGVPMNHLTRTLNERHGRPHKYYRIGTGTEEARRSQWAKMRDGGFAAIGWPELGDLSDVKLTQESKDRVRELLEQKYPNTPQVIGKSASQVLRFVAGFEGGDLVLAADGAKILGVGMVTGDYTYALGEEFPHHRPVQWLSLREWPLPEAEGLRTTVHELRKYPENLLQAERVLLEDQLEGQRPSPPKPDDALVGPSISAAPPKSPAAPPLDLIPARIQAVLERKGQVILYGPPGTGKTFWAETAARELAARSWFGKTYAALSEADRAALRGEEAEGAACGAVLMCSFHAAFGYEDFLEGFRPIERGGALAFERRAGIFKRLCEEARRHPGRGYYLLIDEINRGDIPRIFGELLTVLEKSRRGSVITLALSGEPFAVPANVFLLGTMNTADRSIALLDAALRRRFGFIELMPDRTVLGTAAAGKIPLGLWLEALNGRILANVRRDARNLQIGHTYLMHEGHPITDFNRFMQALRDEILPLLEEYCYEDYELLERILGSGLVQRDPPRLHEALFRPGREEELVQALLQPCPEIMTTAQAVASDAAAKAAEDEEDFGEVGAP